MSIFNLKKHFIFNYSKVDIETLINKLKVNKYFNKHFNGKIGNGKINGFYNSLVLKSLGELPSIIKIKGTYSYEKEEIKLEFTPSITFYVSLLFPITMFALIIAKFYNHLELLILLIVPLVLVIGLLFGYSFELRKFKKWFISPF